MITKMTAILTMTVMLTMVSVTGMAYAQVLGPGDTHIGTPSPAKEGRGPNTPIDPMPPVPTQIFPVPPVDPYPIPRPVDDDPDKKEGGKDPLVIGDWWYYEVNTEQCSSQRYFDYDNDGFKENFCYEIVGSIFVVDFGEGITSGKNMLNFDNTDMQWYTPVGYLQTFPNTCDVYECYLWTDTTRDWVAEPNELKEFDIEITEFVSYPEGLKHDNGRFIYGHGIANNQDFYSLQPTYWMKGY